MDNQANAPKVLKESKNKITVDFERTSLKERLKLKYLNISYVAMLIWRLFRFILLLGVSYVILYPFFSKITASFMPASDFVNPTVKLIPSFPTLDTYKAIILDLNYLHALFDSFIVAAIAALIQTFICCLIGYGFAKFKFRGSKLLFALVLFTMIVPHSTIALALEMKFRYFDIFGIINFLGGGVITSFDIIPEAESGIFKLGTSMNLTNTLAPLIILSLGGLAFKNGLYIYMMRQFFKGVPDELEESAYLDGYGIFKTFFRIVIPLSVPMMITVFLFAFSWQWTDEFYSGMFFNDYDAFPILPQLITKAGTEIESLDLTGAGGNIFTSAVNNTIGLMIIAPLLVVYLFCQRYLVEGIERSGIVG